MTQARHRSTNNPSFLPPDKIYKLLLTERCWENLETTLSSCDIQEDLQVISKNAPAIILILRVLLEKETCVLSQDFTSVQIILDKVNIRQKRGKVATQNIAFQQLAELSRIGLISIDDGTVHITGLKGLVARIAEFYGIKTANP